MVLGVAWRVDSSERSTINRELLVLGNVQESFVRVVLMDLDSRVVVTELLDTAYVVVMPMADESAGDSCILILENLLQVLDPDRKSVV